MTHPELTKGALPLMVSDDDRDHPLQPICQILTLKKIGTNNNGTAPDRFRVILSDGDNYSQAMLSTHIRPMIDNGELQRYTIVKVRTHSASSVADRRVLILLDLEVVGQADDRIGTPILFEKRIGEQGEAPVKREDNSRPTAFKNDNKPDASSGGSGFNRATAPRQATTTAPTPNMPIYPIEALSPYQNKWMIKARVTSKSDIKHWSNQKGEGKLFSCNFMDESAEIKATAFNDQVDRWYNMLKEGNVYFVTKAKVTIARKQYSSLPNEYEIAFERDTVVTECHDATDVPEIKFDFKPLDQLDGVEPKQSCDVITIVEDVGELTTIMTKAQNKPFSKRDLTLVDQSGWSVKLTLWGKTAESYGTSSGQVGCGVDDKPVIAFKGVNVSDFGGRSLSMLSSATMTVNPDIPEAHGLKGWYDSEGQDLSMKKAWTNYSSAGLGGTGMGAGSDFTSNLKERKTIAEAKEENLGMAGGDKADYFNVQATIVHVRNDNLYYPACRSDSCNKKVNLSESGDSWRCEKCEKSFDKPDYRYIISLNVQDRTGQMWFSCFNDVGEQMMGITANDYNAKKEAGEDAELALICLKASSKTYTFNIRAKQETFNDNPKIRYTITKMVPLDFVKAGEELVEAIKKYL